MKISRERQTRCGATEKRVLGKSKRGQVNPPLRVPMIMNRALGYRRLIVLLLGLFPPCAEILSAKAPQPPSLQTPANSPPTFPPPRAQKISACFAFLSCGFGEAWRAARRCGRRAPATRVAPTKALRPKAEFGEIKIWTAPCSAPRRGAQKAHWRRCLFLFFVLCLLSSLRAEFPRAASYAQRVCAPKTLLIRSRQQTKRVAPPPSQGTALAGSLLA